MTTDVTEVTVTFEGELEEKLLAFARAHFDGSVEDAVEYIVHDFAASRRDEGV
jgi:hypothetical protein